MLTKPIHRQNVPFWSQCLTQNHSTRNPDVLVLTFSDYIILMTTFILGYRQCTGPDPRGGVRGGVTEGSSRLPL